MNAFVFDKNLEDESRIINQLLASRRFGLRFPNTFLELQFLTAIRERGISTIRDNFWLVLVFYAVVGVVTHSELQFLSEPRYLAYDSKVWWSVYLAEGAMIGLLLACSQARRLNSLYWGYMTVVGVGCLTAITVATAAFSNPYFNQHSSYVIMLVLMIIYGVANLRMLHALSISLAGGVLSLALILGFGLHHDWGQFGQYFIMSNLVGLGVCYVLERRDRIMFLQGRLLELEKYQLDVLSQRLNQLSREDALTGLANRRHFNEVMQREWERSRREQQPLSMIFIDIDHFKPYNDAHGHLDGDQTLAAVGNTLRQAVRRSVDLAARYGGEEFVVLLPNTGREGAVEVAHNIQAAIDDMAIPHMASGVAAHVTASIGVATAIPGKDRGPSLLIASADAAVYAAKAQGRHRIVVQPD